MSVNHALEHVDEIGVRLDAIEFGGFDQRADDRPPLAAAVASRKQMVLAAERNRAVILPMSGRKLKFVTDGTRFMGGVFAANTRSGAPAASSSTSRRSPVWSSWWRRGCSIRPRAPE